MSNREKIIQLLEGVPEYKLGYVLAYIQGLTADGAGNEDEAEDDAFCERMYREYMDDPERGDFVSFENALRELGVSADELQE